MANVHTHNQLEEETHDFPDVPEGNPEEDETAPAQSGDVDSLTPLLLKTHIELGDEPSRPESRIEWKDSYENYVDRVIHDVLTKDLEVSTLDELITPASVLQKWTRCRKTIGDLCKWYG